MQAFAELIERLEHSRGPKARVAALVVYFEQSDPGEAAWGLQVLLGQKRRRMITGRRLRQICLEGTPLPPWLFDDCYAHVGDSAETIALLWGQIGGRDEPPAEAMPTQPLQVWMEQLLPRAAALDGAAQAEAVRHLWQGLNPQQLLVANKLLTGGLRVGVAQGLVVQALAQLSGLDQALIQHRLMGGFAPSAAAFAALLAPGDGNDSTAVPSRPYPFYLASPLQEPLPGSAGDWQAEWKWDGIRGQLIHRNGQCFLWSRGEELLHDSFPELIAAGITLPEGTVLDGEVIVWPPGADRPAPFHALQRRLGRKKPSSSVLSDNPAAFVAYDLLEHGGADWRSRPLQQRRQALEGLLQQVGGTAATVRLRLSERLVLQTWEQLEPLRQQARAAGAEGLMLKALASPYLSGRKRGNWWKHKLDPYTLDAVLLYAQAGSGRRANLYTDYTFGLWDGAAGDGDQPPRLVSFAKAYSGLDDGEITALDRWIRSHTTERFGPVRAVEPLQVFELAFEGIQRSSRHKSGIAVRFPRISRWRHDKPASEADTLASALALLQQAP
jgi:DNA ligase 1